MVAWTEHWEVGYKHLCTLANRGGHTLRPLSACAQLCELCGIKLLFGFLIQRGSTCKHVSYGHQIVWSRPNPVLLQGRELCQRTSSQARQLT